jgi:hypothetical protein
MRLHPSITLALTVLCIVPCACDDGATTFDCPTVEDPVSRPAPPDQPEQVDYLVITADPLARAAEEHAAYRDETGHRSEVLTLSEVLDDGEGGVISNQSQALAVMREAIGARRGSLDESRTLFVLLLGDADEEWSGDTSLVPTAQLTGWEWEEADEVTSDNSIADLDGDDIPDVALGRIPARTLEEAEAVLERTRELESSYRPGLWSSQVHVFASEAGFGDLIDEMIEDAGFAAVREVPAEWQLSLTYARPGSPYAYPPAGFSDRIYELLNAGSVTMIYIGHGAEGGFDSVNWEGEWAPILDTDDIGQLEMTDRAPMLVFIACLTGAFDTGESLAELFLHQARGPVAVVASTEISHPFTNGVLVRELAYTVLTQRQPTVGEAFLEAKRRLVTAADDPIRQELEAFAVVDPNMATPEQREDLMMVHEHMYVLLGDPAHRIDYPAGTVEIALEDRALAAGDEVRACVQVHGPPSGHAIVTLETEREVLGFNTEEWEMDDPDRDEVVVRNYERANDKSLERWEGEYDGGGFGVVFPTSSEHTGTLVLRAYVWDDALDALGSAFVEVEPSR